MDCLAACAVLPTSPKKTKVPFQETTIIIYLDFIKLRMREWQNSKQKAGRGTESVWIRYWTYSVHRATSWTLYHQRECVFPAFPIFIFLFTTTLWSRQSRFMMRNDALVSYFFTMPVIIPRQVKHVFPDHLPGARTCKKNTRNSSCPPRAYNLMEELWPSPSHTIKLLREWGQASRTLQRRQKAE